MKLLWRLIGLTVFLAPIAVLAVLGASYFLECLLWVSGPGTSMTVPIQTEAGIVTLRTGPYTIDPIRGFVRASDATLTDSDGKLLVSAGQIVVHAPGYLQIQNSAVRVDIESLRTDLVRLPDGSLAFMKYFKPKATDEPPVPVRVSIRGARILYVDQTAQPAFAEPVRFERVEFDSADNAWRAQGAASIEDGRIEFDVRSMEGNKIQAEGRILGLEAADLWERVKRIREIRREPVAQAHSAQSLRLEGPFRASWSEATGFRWTSSARAQVVAWRFPEWPRPVTGTFEGYASHAFATGRFDANDGESDAEFLGKVSWADGLKILGRASAASPRLATLPLELRGKLPKGLDAEGIVWAGPLRIDGSKWSVGGVASIRRASWQGETVEGVRAAINGDERRLAVRVDQARWLGATFLGAIDWAATGDRLSGFVESTNIDLSRVGDRFRERRMEGRASVRATLGGTVQAPIADVRASGSGSFDLGPDWGRRRGLFELAGSLQGDVFLVKRAVLASGNGSLAATGSANLDAQTLDLRVRGAGIEIADWMRDSEGLLAVSVSITGPWKDLRAKGRAELLNATIQGESAPLIVASLDVDSRRARLEDIGALRGASRIEGFLAVDWKTRELDGSLKGEGLQLADFLGPRFVGNLSVRSQSIGGTLDHPVAELTVAAEGLVANDVRIDSASARVEIDGGLISIESARLRSGPGAWQGSAWYNAELRSGRLTGAGSGIDLETVVPVLAQDFVVDGTVNVATELTIVDGRVGSALVSGDVAGLQINPTVVGSGTFRLELQDAVWRGNLEIGQLERYIQIPEFRYAPDENEIAGQLTAFGIPIEDIYLAIKPKLASASLEPRPGKIAVDESLLVWLDRLKGDLAANIVVRGDPAEPEVEVETLEVSSLMLAGEEAGIVSLVGNRGPSGRWTISRASWTGGPGEFNADGTISESGEIQVSGELRNFKPTWLTMFDPAFAKATGFANLTFDAAGTIEEPTLRASLDAKLFERAAEEGAEASYWLIANIAPITIDAKGIVFEGDVESQGLRGGVEGRLPFEYPVRVPDDQPIDVQLSVPRRRVTANGEIEQGAIDLAEFAKSVDGLVVAGDRRDLRANVRVGGTLSRIQMSGEANLGVDRLGWEGIETELRGVDSTVRFDGSKVELVSKATSNFTGKGEKPGAIDARLTATLPGNGTLEQTEWSRLLDTRVSGKVALRDFRIKEVDAELGYSIDLQIGADVRISGPLTEPTISTLLPARIEDVSATMPTTFPASEGQAQSEFNPRFAISYVIGNAEKPANVKAITANFDLHGAGGITGSLAQLNANAALNIERGAIRLPNARVSIREGGTARFLFRGRESGQGDLRLDVDLEGRTSLSSVRSGGSVQRYDVELAIRGNLLSEDETVIQARSDPPDLSQAQILNMLGQQDLVEGLANQFVGDRDRSALARTLAGVALPSILDPFTERLAQELGLEFLQLDYNAFEGASITAAKSFGKGLMFQGRRQLQEQFDGRIHFDYRLTWRPPAKFKNFRNLIFSIGADQDRPWKIAVEYGIRF